MDTTITDLKDDFTELQELGLSAQKHLGLYVTHLKEQPSAYQPATHRYLTTQAETLAQDLSQFLGDIQTARVSLDVASAGNIEACIVNKRQLRDTLRILQSTMASLVSAGNWQSPSVRYTHDSQAGNETGSIEAYKNDYKRDRHADEKEYAHMFVREYVDHPTRLAPNCFVTSSGMAAVLTALSHILSRVPHTSPIIAGTHTYFQSKWILESLFPHRVRYVDESNTAGFLTEIQKSKPAIVFLDTISNNAYAMPNMSVLLPALFKILPRTSMIVLDNTGLSVAGQPLAHMPHKILASRLIVIESLSKYHQFGLDRVNGGVIWFPHQLMFPMFATSRSNMGTIMPDTSVLAQPKPNRVLLERRLSRIGRNAMRIAECLDVLARAQKASITKVIYPGLESHPAYEWAKNSSFKGGFLSCEFSLTIVEKLRKENLVQRICDEAKKRNVPVVVGAGFGFDTTRVYILPEIKGVQKTVLRISAGTETAQEVDALCEALRAALS